MEHCRQAVAKSIKAVYDASVSLKRLQFEVERAHSSQIERHRLQLIDIHYQMSREYERNYGHSYTIEIAKGRRLFKLN